MFHIHKKRAWMKWLRVWNAVVILSMTLQPVGPAILYAQSADEADEPAVEESAATETSDAPEEKAEDSAEVVAEPEEKAVKEASEDPVAKEALADDDEVISEPAAESDETVAEETPADAGEVADDPNIPNEPTVEAEGPAFDERGAEPESVEAEESVEAGDTRVYGVWHDNGDGSATVTVKEGGEYAYGKSGFRIRFTKIDAGKNADHPCEITVREVRLSAEQSAKLGALSDAAYDITSSMENGSFEYELILPTDDGKDGDEIEVVYADTVEDLLDAEKAETVDPDDVTLDAKDGEVRVSKIDHFTFFAVKRCERLGVSVEYDEYEPGETVRAEADGLEDGKRYRTGFRDADGVSVSVSPCRRADGDRIDFEYVLSSEAVTGEWRAFVDEYASGDRSCRGNVADQATDTFAVISRPEPAANPEIDRPCGTDIAIVVDRSNSIDQRQLGDVKKAISEFVDALSGTPTRFSVIRFGSSAELVRGFTDDTSSVKDAIGSIRTGGGATDWAAAIRTAHDAFDPRPDVPDLILLLSDGDPTAPHGRGDVTDRGDIYDAIGAANDAKADGIRILAIGVGRDPSVRNLQAISGETVDAADILDSDVVTTDFGHLSRVLSDFVRSSCGGTVTVNKYLNDTDHPAGKGFSFSMGGRFVTTDAYGIAGPVKVSEGREHGWYGHGCDGRDRCDQPKGYDMIEIGMPEGFSFDSAVCRDQHGREKGVATENGVRDIKVRDEEIISCDVINHEESASIKGRVFVDADGDGVREAGERFEKHWTIGLYADDGDRWFDPATDELIRTSETGDCDGNRYCFEGVAPGRYYLVENLWDGYAQSRPLFVRGRDFYRVRIEDGQIRYFQFGNYAKGSISGMKWEDADADGTRDEGESGVPEWAVSLCRYGLASVSETGGISYESEDDGDLEGEGDAIPVGDECVPVAETMTGEDGSYSFRGLEPGHYRVTEETRGGWEASTDTFVDVDVSGDKNDEGNAVSGVDFGNYRSGVLSIKKRNDADDEKLAGEKVRYTLTVTASEGRVKGVKVADLPPEVTTYTPGSWSASSSLGGAHVGNLKLDHIYASPGIWDLGDLQEGETITLAYDTTVNDDVDPGDYPDLAFARGLGRGGVLLAEAGTDGNLGDANYVGTLIAVKDTTEPESVDVDVDAEKKKEVVEEQEGTLPATGTSGFWSTLSVILIGLGALLLLVGSVVGKGKFPNVKSMAKKLFSLVFAVALGAGLLVPAAPVARAETDPQEIFVRMEEPGADWNEDSFVLDYVVLDIADTDTITAECQVSTDGVTWTTFETDMLEKGGDSGQCDVTSSELPDDDVYAFRVTATTSTDTATSASYDVAYDTTRPGQPKYIEKEREDDCRNKVKLKTTDDGQTEYIEIYRDDSTEFDADADHLINTVSIGPDEKYDFIDHLPNTYCGETVYYAVRAFDDAGNGSKVRAEEGVETVRVTETSRTTAPVTLTPGAAETAAGEGEEAGTGEEAGAGETGEAATGEVAGEETSLEGEVEGVSTTAERYGWILWVLAAIAAGYAAYWRFVAKKGNDGKQA